MVEVIKNKLRDKAAELVKKDIKDLTDKDIEFLQTIKNEMELDEEKARLKEEQQQYMRTAFARYL